MSASDKQHGGGHYAKLPIEMQPWNVLQHWLTPEEYRGWQKGVSIVYLARERDKGGDLDIQKAAHHLERLIEEFLPRANTQPPTPAEAEAPDVDDAQMVESRPLPVLNTPEDAQRRSGDGWIEWCGGECPVSPDARVDVRVSSGALILGETARYLLWAALLGRRVVAYRIAKEQA